MPEDDLDRDGMRASCLTSDADRWVMPKDFVWELGRAVRLARKAREAAALAQGSPQPNAGEAAEQG